MALVNIKDEKVKLIMVGGKGGVGKTTCAAAVALKLAMDKQRVLVVSSDPAPSLSDIFEKEIGDRETRVHDMYELYASKCHLRLYLNGGRSGLALKSTRSFPPLPVSITILSIISGRPQE
jgi:arsenite-transporting ATPase